MVSHYSNISKAYSTMVTIPFFCLLRQFVAVMDRFSWHTINKTVDLFLFEAGTLRVYFFVVGSEQTLLHIAIDGGARFLEPISCISK
jgi:hypothetical protein